MSEHIRTNIDEISGWANEGEFNRQSIALSNILRRKTETGTLPQLHNAQSKIVTEHKKHSSHNIPQLKRISNHLKKPIQPKNQRQKTQGCEKDIKERYVKMKVMGVIEEEITPSRIISSREKALTSQIVKIKQQKHSESNKQQKFNFDMRQMQSSMAHQKDNPSKMVNVNSHKLIFSNSIQFFSPKRTEDKFYVKLNKLELDSNYRQLKETHQNKGQFNYHCISDKRQLNFNLTRSKKSHSKVELAPLQKMNHKFRQTFIKQDIFSRGKKKLQRPIKVESSHQFSDQVIFSRNSIVLRRGHANQRPNPTY